MANIRKRGDKWQVQVRRQGFPSRSRTFNRHQEAAAWARAQELAMDRLEATGHLHACLHIKRISCQGNACKEVGSK